MFKIVVFILLFNITYTLTIEVSNAYQPTQKADESNNTVLKFQLQDAINEEKKAEGAKPKTSTAQVIKVQEPIFERKEPEETQKSIKDVDKKTLKNSSESKQILNNSTSMKIPSNKIKGDLIQSGALIRGFYVFLGLSVITLLYFLFRSHRLRYGNQPTTTVRKYGVVARRGDMEMLPLPLDDEDDDTLFDVGNHTNR